MKNYKIVVLFILGLLVIGCGSDDDTSSSEDLNNLDQSSYTVSGDVIANVENGVARIINRTINLDGEVSHSLEVTFRDENGDNDITLTSNILNTTPIEVSAGNYSIGLLGDVNNNNADFSVSFVTNTIGLVIPQSISGSIEFTTVSSNSVEGNFEFTMVGSSVIESGISINVSNGEFNAVYNEILIEN